MLPLELSAAHEVAGVTPEASRCGVCYTMSTFAQPAEAQSMEPPHPFALNLLSNKRIS